VEGADFRFQERMRGVVEYMQYREMPAEIKRKVRSIKRAREGEEALSNVQHGSTKPASECCRSAHIH
jgi:hypothetical protein